MDVKIFFLVTIEDHLKGFGFAVDEKMDQLLVGQLSERAHGKFGFLAGFGFQWPISGRQLNRSGVVFPTRFCAVFRILDDENNC